MFTGIVENTGEVKAISNINRYKRAHTRIRINIGNLSKGLKIGDSMSVNGSCLTVIRKEGNTADFEMVKETIMRSSLGKLRIGDKVNLERSLKINSRLEGHIVLCHVDGSGQVSRIRKSTSQI
jgi:riboflavin synthase